MDDIDNIKDIDSPGLGFSRGEAQSQELQSDSSAPDPAACLFFVAQLIKFTL